MGRPPRSYRISTKADGPPFPVKGTRAVFRAGHPESGNSLSSSSSVGHRLNCSVCGLAFGAPVSIPEWFATTRFTSVSTASRLNRGSTSCTARRRATATRARRAIGLVSPKTKMISFRFGGDNIGRTDHARKREFFIPTRAHCSHFNTRKKLGAASHAALSAPSS